MTDWKAEYDSLLSSILAACKDSECLNAYELRQALDAEREAVRLLAAELARVPELVSKVVMKNPIAAKALKEAKA